AGPRVQVLPGWLGLLDEQLDRVRFPAHRQQAVQDPAPVGLLQPPRDEGDVGVCARVEQPGRAGRAVPAGVAGAEARGGDPRPGRGFVQRAGDADLPIAQVEPPADGAEAEQVPGRERDGRARRWPLAGWRDRSPPGWLSCPPASLAGPGTGIGHGPAAAPTEAGAPPTLVGVAASPVSLAWGRGRCAVLRRARGIARP